MISLPLRLSARPPSRERWLRLGVCLSLALALPLALACEPGRRHWLRAVLLQDRASCFELSQRARLGIGQRPDSRRARFWLLRAASAGEPRARLVLAAEQMQKAASALEPRERRRFLRVAAELGDPRASFALAREEPSFAARERWFRAATDQGQAEAIFLSARGEPDPAQAAELYRQAIRAARREGRAGSWEAGLWVEEVASEALWHHLKDHPLLRRPEDATLASPAKIPRSPYDEDL